MKSLITVLIIGTMLAVVVPGYAHHSFTADYNREKPATIEGTVTEFWFENPHTRIYMEVEEENGEVEVGGPAWWSIRASTPPTPDCFLGKRRRDHQGFETSGK